MPVTPSLTGHDVLVSLLVYAVAYLVIYPTGFLYLAAIAFCALAFFALLMPETGQGRERSREGAGGLAAEVA